MDPWQLGFRWDFCVQAQPSQLLKQSANYQAQKNDSPIYNMYNVQFITGNWKLKGFFVKKTTFHPLSIHPALHQRAMAPTLIR